MVLQCINVQNISLYTFNGNIYGLAR